MSGPPQTEGAGECEEGDDPGPAAAALYGGVDEEDGRQLHQPAQRRARVHARAHRARSWGQRHITAQLRLEIEWNLNEFSELFHQNLAAVCCAGA